MKIADVKLDSEVMHLKRYATLSCDPGLPSPAVILSDPEESDSGVPGTRGFRVLGWSTEGESKDPEDVSCANADSGNFNDEPHAHHFNHVHGFPQPQPLTAVILSEPEGALRLRGVEGPRGFLMYERRFREFQRRTPYSSPTSIIAKTCFPQAPQPATNH